MFNAYFLRDGHRVSVLEGGGPVAWVDSGGFLFLEAPQRSLRLLPCGPSATSLLGALLKLQRLRRPESQRHQRVDAEEQAESLTRDTPGPQKRA